MKGKARWKLEERRKGGKEQEGRGKEYEGENKTEIRGKGRRGKGIGRERGWKENITEIGDIEKRGK